MFSWDREIQRRGFSPGDLLAGLHDSSWFVNPSGGQRFHVVAEGGVPACNTTGACISLDCGIMYAQDVPRNLRCQRSGCRQRWPQHVVPTPREAFAALLARRAQLSEELLDLASETTRVMTLDLREYLLIRRVPRITLRTADEKVRARAADVLEGWEFAAILRRHHDAYRARRGELKAEAAWVRHRLYQLADDCPIHTGGDGTWEAYRTVWGSTYASQGWGANSYARGRAQLYEVELLALGIEAVRIVEVPRESTEALGRKRRLPPDWRVEVQVEDLLDVEILRHRPPLTEREFVRECWRRGLNPRVYMPWLDHDAEARYGLDYQGREVAK